MNLWNKQQPDNCLLQKMEVTVEEYNYILNSQWVSLNVQGHEIPTDLWWKRYIPTDLWWKLTAKTSWSPPVPKGDWVAIHSSPAGRLSSIRLMNFILISVTLSPFSVSWTNFTSTAIWTWEEERRTVISLKTAASLGTVWWWRTSLRTLRAWHTMQSSTEALIIFQDHTVLVHCGPRGGQRAPYLSKCTSYRVTGTPCRDQSPVCSGLRVLLPHVCSSKTSAKQNNQV